MTIDMEPLGYVEVPEDQLEEHKARFVYEETDGQIKFPYAAIPLNHGEKVYVFIKKPLDKTCTCGLVAEEKKSKPRKKMSRPKNPDNVYEVTCRVTGKTKPTNPVQFNKLCLKYGLNNYDMANSYVSQEGRQILAKEYLSPQEAVDRYNLHPVVANALRATVKSKEVPAPVGFCVPANATFTEETAE